LKQKKDLAFFKQAVEQSSNHIIFTNQHGQILFANQAAQDITGYCFSEMKGKTPALWGKQMDPSFYQSFWQKIKHEKKPFIGEVKNKRKNGESYTALLRVTPLFHHDGSISSYIGTEEDISNRVITEQHLEEQTTKLEAIIQSMGDGVIVTDHQGIIIKVNNALCRILHGSPELYLNTPIYQIPAYDKNHQLIPKEQRPVYRALTEKTLIQEQIFYQTANQQLVQAGVTITPLTYQETVIGTVAVIRDITREKEIEQSKTDFISLASHQLRTPLSAIKWFAEMLLHGDAGSLSPESKEFLNHIYKSNERMIELVNALLNISRIEAGKIQLEPKSTKIRQLIEEAVEDIQPSLQERKQLLTVQEEGIVQTVWCDPQMIRNVTMNLLSNAIKYSPSETIITITIAYLPKLVKITVQDQGYGIPKTEQDKLFTKFYRGSNVTKKETDGTGLGLYLVKAIIGSSGGTIDCQSEENHGTTITFTLPLSKQS
jgi:PAS domain S-box-containing protein